MRQTRTPRSARLPGSAAPARALPIECVTRERGSHDPPIEKTPPAIDRGGGAAALVDRAGGLVHLFGTGHSRIAVEEIFPRHGSFPGFHPIVELSLTYHTQVVGANGQRQAMFLERIEGFGEVILRNFMFGPHDSCMWSSRTAA